jgi:hypothetical protein
MDNNRELPLNPRDTGRAKAAERLWPKRRVGVVLYSNALFNARRPNPMVIQHVTEQCLFTSITGIALPDPGRAGGAEPPTCGWC